MTKHQVIKYSSYGIVKFVPNIQVYQNVFQTCKCEYNIHDIGVNGPAVWQDSNKTIIFPILFSFNEPHRMLPNNVPLLYLVKVSAIATAFQNFTFIARYSHLHLFFD